MITIHRPIAALVVFLCLVVAAEGIAQEGRAAERPYEGFSHGLGFSAGNISGVGLSYRQWLGKVGYQAAAGGYFMPVSELGVALSNLDYWVGLEGFYQLYANQFSDWFYSQLYLFVGANHHGFIHPIYPESTDPAKPEPPPTPGSYTAEFGVGGGIGIEAGLFQHISTVFEIGYALTLPTIRVELVPQGVIQYRF